MTPSHKTISDLTEQEKERVQAVREILSQEEVYAGAAEAERQYSLYLESMLHWRDHHKKPEALDGVRVILATYDSISGLYAGSLLAELGAEVIKVEPPNGDPLVRKFVPFGNQRFYFTGKDPVTGQEIAESKITPKGLDNMRNMKDITQNLDSAKGRELFLKLIPHMDALIENYPPGRFDEWGIGYRHLSTLHPRLVYCWIGSIGQWGRFTEPYRKQDGRPIYSDVIGQASSGLVHTTGIPKEQGGRPTKGGWPSADLAAGVYAALHIVAALHHRRKTGRGQFIEVTGAESIMRVMDFAACWYGMRGAIKGRFGNWDLAINIYSVNPCGDGLFMVGGGHDRLWYRIWKTVGKEREDLEEIMVPDPKLRDVVDRLDYYNQVKTLTCLTEWLRDHTRFEAERELLSEQVAGGGVTSPDEIADYPHFKYRGHISAHNDLIYGNIVTARNPLYMERTPARIKWMGRPLGFDNMDVYYRLAGLTMSEIRRLREEGVV